MSRELTTAREALLADLLSDVDTMIQRFEQVDASIAERIESATRDAVNKALLASQMRFEAMVGDQERKLTDAGRHAAACIGNELTYHGQLLSNASAAVAGRLRGLLPAAFGLGLLAGSIGGLTAMKVLGH